MAKTIKVAITGAAGQIGYALIYRIASGQMFGEGVKLEINLIELEHSMGQLHGVAMELEDCAFPLVEKVICTSDLAKGMQDVNWALLIGSAPRKAGMERSDLLEVNGGIFAEQGKIINDYADPNVRVLVVGNPCNTNALIAMSNAKDIPREQFFAMTMLDELRAKAQLAIKSNCAITDVNNICIWGNHSATQYPDFYHVKIKDKTATDVIDDLQWLQNDFITTVQKRGAQVIEARGLSSAASAANAIIRTVNALVFDTDDGDSFSVSSCSNGDYGVDTGLIFSFPTKTTNGKASIITGIEHCEFSQSKIHHTLEELRTERDIVHKLKLIKD